MKRQNMIGFLINFTGVILFICGIGASLYMESVSGLFGSFVVLMLFLGFGEVINLLEKIYLEFRYLTRGEEVEHAPNPSPVSKESDHFFTIQPLTPEDKEKVYHYYSQTPNREIRITNTPYDKVALVTIKGEHHVVQVNGEVTRLSEEERKEKVPRLTTWAKERKGIQFDDV